MSVAPSSPTSSNSTPLSATFAPSRRSLLLGGAAVGAATLLPAPAHAADVRREGAALSDLFTLGVASGEPLPDGVVLWTRLAPDPLALDGLGGMPAKPVAVSWQVATDPRFRQVVRAGAAQARPEEAHTVHVEVSGLQPGREYWYRFRARGELSPVGRTRTAPPAGSRLDRFAFAMVSCQNWPDGHYTAYQHLAQEDLELVVHLGDYIYEGGGQGTIGRGHLPATEIFTLADYRVRHAQYKTDPHLQATHAAFPWMLVWDDHEVENNYADDISQPDTEPDQDPAVFRQRRAAAYQAYYEHMPLRRDQKPHGPDLVLYRRRQFGDLVDFRFLDTRQYRDDQVPADRRLEPGRTILGAEQRQWLEASLAGSTGLWNVLAQQVFFSQRDFTSGPAQTFSDDAWDNYPRERDALVDHLAAVGTSNPVVLTGDVHASYVSDVLDDFDRPSSRVVATELVGTSITSGGDGVEQNPGDAVQLAENPHLKFINRRRGYVRHQLTRESWTADYRTVDHVRQPGAPIRDKARFVIEDGRPGAQRA